MQSELPLTPAGGSADPPPENSRSPTDLVSENAVVVFARKGCCMCHVIKLLLHGHGVNPTVCDVGERNEADVARELSVFIRIKTAPPQLPAVFVGGQLFGGLEEIMGAHISGELMPKLRAAGALWL